MDFYQRILTYFISPMETGYDIPKTLVYASVLVIAAYGVFEVLKRMKLEIDEKLVISIIPFIIMGSTLRVIQDAGLIDSYFFYTPGIYMLIFSISFSVILVSLFLQKRKSIPYYKTSFILGLLPLPFLFSCLSFENPQGALLVSLFFIPWILVYNSIQWKLGNKIVSLLHLFDATVTAVSMKFFGYYEQHIIPTVFIESFGSFSFIFLKLAVITSSLLIIDRISKEENMDKSFIIYVKLIIGILGAATGIRDFITLLAGV